MRIVLLESHLGFESEKFDISRCNIFIFIKRKSASIKMTCLSTVNNKLYRSLFDSNYFCIL